MSQTTRALSPDVAALVKDFERGEGGLQLTPRKLKGWKQRLAALPSSRAHETVTELLAVSAKYHRLAPAETVQARVQLAALAAVLAVEGPKLKAATGWKSPKKPSSPTKSKR